MTRLRSERGQASIELLGMLPIMLICGLLAWQLLLTVSAVNTVENAARTGSRTEGRGGDGKRAALRALPESHRRDAEVSVRGETVKVKVEVPLVVPGLHTGIFTVSGDASLPRT
jgi:TadE-like protein